MSAERNGVDVLADLRGVVRIAKAASIGVTGNRPRIERAEQAIAAIADLIAAGRLVQSTRDAYRSAGSGAHRNRMAEHVEAVDAICAAISRVGGVR